ncbi:pemK-like family protein [Desulfovibrio sp. A2]|nr:pemK-like family protein [Desulfovibrio sp. A2]
MKRGQIVMADMPFTDGVEKRGKHPFIILQNDKGNAHSSSIIAVAITDIRQYKHLPIQIPIKKEQLSGLDNPKDSVIECGHIYTIDKVRIYKLTNNIISRKLMKQVEKAIKISLGITPIP